MYILLMYHYIKMSKLTVNIFVNTMVNHYSIKERILKAHVRNDFEISKFTNPWLFQLLLEHLL